MKSIKIYTIIIGLLAITIFISSCDEGFTELNTNKIDPTYLNPEFLINKSIIDGAMGGQEANTLYFYPIVQQCLTPFGTSSQGGNFNMLYPQSAKNLWDDYYANSVKQIVDVVAISGKDETKKNLYHIARIWKAYVFMVLTDTYGDIPYFDAGKGYLEDIISPKYDSQKAIYDDILKELDEASAALTTSLSLSANDILYGGDVTKWKQLGYSLLLRAAMRLTKIDPTLAQTYVTKAVAGGLMQSNASNAVLSHTVSYRNSVGNTLNGIDKSVFYLAEPFVNYLKAKNNPLLPVIAVRYVGALNSTEQTASRATSNPAQQIGLPIGYNDVSIVTTYAANGVVSLFDYTKCNLNTITITSPSFFVTYSQTQFLLAEAMIRGWATGDASSIFSNAIKANMEQMATYGTNAVIDSAAITTYVLDNPLNLATALEQINTEYWVASFLNGSELFSNFRRIGFPILTPNPYPGSQVPGAFIRRLPYPESEYIVNGGNVEEANTRQGPDNFSTRVWWDKQ